MSTKCIEIFTDDLSTIVTQVLLLFIEYSVPFIERNLVHDHEALRDFRNLKLTLVPSFIFNGRVYEGFDPLLWGHLIYLNFGIRIPEKRLRIELPKKHPWKEIPHKIISIPK